MASTSAIGFSQRIKLEWMAETARMVAEGRSDSDIVATLRDALQDKLSVGQNPERGNREKAITILMKVWVRVPDELKPFRDQGLTLLQNLPPELHVAIHWAATVVAYPFFGEVAQTNGRLLRLQDEVSATQMQRRLKERYGEKETVARAARRIQATFTDWGVMSAATAKGTYVPAPRIRISDHELLAWMAEAAIRLSNSTMKPIDDIRQSLAFYPFDLSGIDVTTLPLNNRLDVFRQGIGEMWAKIR